MQALERGAETLPMKPGRPEAREHDHSRHGTLCRTANFEAATGEIVAPTVEPTRNEQDFAAHVGRTVATNPEAGWIFVAYNLTTHCSETPVLLVRRRC